MNLISDIGVLFIGKNCTITKNKVTKNKRRVLRQFIRKNALHDQI